MDRHINSPALWRDSFPFPSGTLHKYTRGHVLTVGGAIHSTGAARLAAMAALRIGAGLSSIACDKEALPVYAASCLAVMTKPFSTHTEFKALIHNERIHTLLIGGGCGVNDTTKQHVLEIVKGNKPCVIDADGLSCFEHDVDMFCEAIRSSDATVILTPHDGEFARLFNDSGDRVSDTVEAAKLSGAVVIRKGAETVIASPEGDVIVNDDAPATLATAGSGDVLAGMVAGLVANHMEPLNAASAAVWIHGECANVYGQGLISEDLPELIPIVLDTLYKEANEC